MTDNLVITISRQYGTGGREIGHKLALRLGISFLDRELITRAAKKSGFSEELFEQLDKRATNSFLYSAHHVRFHRAQRHELDRPALSGAGQGDP